MGWEPKADIVGGEVGGAWMQLQRKSRGAPGRPVSPPIVFSYIWPDISSCSPPCQLQCRQGNYAELFGSLLQPEMSHNNTSHNNRHKHTKPLPNHSSSLPHPAAAFYVVEFYSPITWAFAFIRMAFAITGVSISRTGWEGGGRKYKSRWG